MSGYRTIAETGCWEFTGTKMKNGYGQKWDGNSVTSAHRAVYIRSGLAIPQGYVLDHLCRNPICVNPAHMEPVTQSENIRRGLSGKLSAEQVREIRLLYATTPATHRELARQFGVSNMHISNIINGLKNRDAGGAGKPTSKPHKPSRYDWGRAGEMWRDGRPAQEIASAVEVPAGTLIQHARRHRADFPFRRGGR